MSQFKKDQLFPIKPRAVSDDELAKIVASALQQDFGEMTTAVKQIGKLTNVNLRAIKNWYEARTAPSSGHFLLLARSSPSILKFILMQIGGGIYGMLSGYWLAMPCRWWKCRSLPFLTINPLPKMSL